MMGRGMVEADHSAHQTRARAAAAVAENRVAIVHVVVGQRLDASRGNPRLARKGMSPSVRNESQAACLEPPILHALDREPAAARRHRVKAQATFERRELERPGGGELGPAVEHAGHPQEMESLPERIGRPNQIRQQGEYPPLWTIEQERATNGP